MNDKEQLGFEYPPFWLKSAKHINHKPIYKPNR